MKRRQFLKAAGAVTLPCLAPGVWGAPATPSADWRRILILVELKGGNDGLNTVVPIADPEYARLRPRLAIAPKEALPLADGLALNPALAPLMPLWTDKELAIALGVGYANPNRSHFRSIEIWETGSDSDVYLNEGWLGRLFGEARRSFNAAPPADFAADGIVVGTGETGPLAGEKTRALVLDDPRRFVADAQRVAPAAPAPRNAALARLAAVRNDLIQGAAGLREAIDKAPALKTSFPRTNLGRHLETTARLIVAQTRVAVYKVAQNGFDTHTNQRAQHDRLLGELAEGLAALRTALAAAGVWDRVLVMTYSEFGRRAAENGNGGTDHGTAAPHLLLGGRVRGGFYGRQPALNHLEAGDMRYTLDFRRLYATIARHWWGLPAAGSPHPPLDCIA